MGAVWSEIYALGGDVSALMAWTGAIAYTFQIYFDFSGYSDMAIGLGRMFGFKFPENFRYPYQSVSITDFWRRWHITLSTWFKEYLYIPLGGNRCGLARQALNLLIVWSLTGFWHGAGWNFVMWGLYYFVILFIEKLFLLKALDKLPKLFRHVYALLLIVIGWVIFASDDVSVLLPYLGSMFGANGAVGGHGCVHAFYKGGAPDHLLRCLHRASEEAFPLRNGRNERKSGLYDQKRYDDSASGTEHDPAYRRQLQSLPLL